MRKPACPRLAAARAGAALLICGTLMSPRAPIHSGALLAQSHADATGGAEGLRQIPEPREQQAHPHSHAGAPATAADSAANDDFLAALAASLERYRPVSAAIAEGYRRVGADLPSMGEHWVNTRVALRDTLDPRHPPILIYMVVGGERRLAGVAYTKFLQRDDPYPAFPHGIAHAWHDHNGPVDEETLPLKHLIAHASTPRGMRVAVLHAWVPLGNPAGVWSSENWALPWARLGLALPRGAPDAAAKSLSLLAGGDDYFHRAAVDAAEVDGEESAALRAVVTRWRDSVARRAEPALAKGELEGPAIADLAAMWPQIWDEILGAVNAPAAERLRVLRRAVE
jgi:hypothetical protein